MQEKLSLSQLRKQWAKVWGIQPHKAIGRTMMEKSLKFKTQNKLTSEQQVRLAQLVRQYKRNPRCFDGQCVTLKPGMRLVRNWKGTRHAVTIKKDGFDYQGQHYNSLSRIANGITGSRCNLHTTSCIM